MSYDHVCTHVDEVPHDNDFGGVLARKRPSAIPTMLMGTRILNGNSDGTMVGIRLVGVGARSVVPASRRRGDEPRILTTNGTDYLA
jgi:hypothetical protein